MDGADAESQTGAALRYRCDDRTIIRAVTPRAAASSLTPTRREASEGRLEEAGLVRWGRKCVSCELTVCACRKRMVYLQAGTGSIFLSAFILRLFYFFCITRCNNKSGLLLCLQPEASN